MKPILLLIDGSNLLHRVAHIKALTDLDNGMVFGFLNSIVRIAQKKRGKASAIVCWDKGTPIRCGMDKTGNYKSWKHGSSIVPQEKRAFLDAYRKARIQVHDLLLMSGIPSLMLDTFEADDLLYYVVHKIKHPKKVIVSEDRDLLQLMNETTSLYKPMRDETWTPERLISEYQLSEDNHVSDYLLHKAMVGDASDGIIGVKGIGDKTAMSIVQALAVGKWSPKTARDHLIASNLPILERNLPLVDISHVVLTNLKDISQVDMSIRRLELNKMQRRATIIEKLRKLRMNTILGSVDDLLSVSVSIEKGDFVKKPEWPELRFKHYAKKGLKVKYRWAGTRLLRGH